MGGTVRGIRGAVRVERNSKEEILERTKELLLAIMEENRVGAEDIVSVFFTATEDINAEFPAYALRELGLKYVPSLCAREISVPDRMERVIRVLVLVYTELKPDAIKHQYIGKTKMLRPDLAGGENDNRHET